ncbi:hypothetical protein O181_029884 [Austropuccinia psidii MF-1]|uniref:Gag-Pol-p199 n=1 Tax=Austropuccinia psidii MF-1 TaxID=1389203 RepID=A0A9Q3CRR3_9BASI|nr:hypothetical protein [Austropuccinia psidii MF-1]
MANPTDKPITSAMDEMSLLAQADRQAEIFHRFTQLAERIRPRLTYDGVNFNAWSRGLMNAWQTYFNGEKDYFELEQSDPNHLRNLVAISFIEYSIQHDIFTTITSRMRNLSARSIYQAIRSRFNKPSWSSIIHNAKILFNTTDQMENINKFSLSVYEAISNIENQIGPLDGEKIATFSIFFAVPQLRDHITAALNTRLATNPHLKIHTNDLLDMIRQIVSASPSFDHSTDVARINASFPGHNTKDDRKKHRSTSAPRPPNQGNKPKKESKTFDPTRPCFYCGELGHWVPNCPVKEKAMKLRTHPTENRTSIASLDTGPSIESLEALLDSGATHSVVGDLSLFSDIKPANMSLSVASKQKLPVVGIGQIRLKIGGSTLIIKHVLYCKGIPGIILSIGQMLTQQIKVEFSDNRFIISQAGSIFHSFRKNERWFLMVQKDPEMIDIKPLCINDSDVTHVKSTQKSDNFSFLWHQRMGHLSIRNLNRLLKYNAADGIIHSQLQNIGVCHPCSVAKSQHRPVKNASRNLVEKAGDVIVVDLIGPLPVSLNNMKYVLMIQDVFSRVVVAIPILDKSEAKSKLMHWMIQFSNVTKNSIKILRSDNGAEFKNNVIDQFLLSKGVIHELAMPYEHHQNGQVERTNRTISEMARTMLHASNLPFYLWPWAFRHAAWIYNRTLHADSKKTPFELLGNRRPSLEMLRVFGAVSFIHDHNFKKDFSARAVTGYHLGIAENSKGWLFWIPGRKSIARSASVKFDEYTFYNNTQPKLQSIQINNLFDESMVKEINQQDKLIATLTKETDPAVMLPTTYREAIHSKEKEQWLGAIKDELNSMKEENVFETVDLRHALAEVPHESILSTKWVFVKKPERYKARLVARGFKQIHGINYDETFAPTPTFNALRLLFSTSCLKKWPIRTFDVKVAFLHSLIDKPVYIWFPQGMDSKKFSVLKLNKALYGTKQAARCWWLHLKNILEQIGFQPNNEDMSTYIFNRGVDKAILWIHVDDGAITASSETLMSELMRTLNMKLKIKWNNEICGLVGIDIKKLDNGFKFYQPDLINKLTHLNESNITAKSPLPINCKLESNPSKEMDKAYLRRIGILLYIAQASRPNICQAVNYLARFSMGTTQEHWLALEHLISYMRGTCDMGILIANDNKSSEIRCYVDANWGGEGDRSTHGYLLLHGKNPISWQSKRQTTIASSTAQAEYMSLSFAVRECIWVSNLFQPILGELIPTMLSDNKTAIGISTASMSRKQTRHLIRDFNLINEYITCGKIKLQWISTDHQLADILTKPVGFIKTGQFSSVVNWT